jgi:hypothetical protein
MPDAADTDLVTTVQCNEVTLRIPKLEEPLLVRHIAHLQKQLELTIAYYDYRRQSWTVYNEDE